MDQPLKWDHRRCGVCWGSGRATWVALHGHDAIPCRACDGKGSYEDSGRHFVWSVKYAGGEVEIEADDFIDAAHVFQHHFPEGKALEYDKVRMTEIGMRHKWETEIRSIPEEEISVLRDLLNKEFVNQ